MNKKITFPLFFLLLSLSLTSCVGDIIKYFDSESYPVKVIQSSELFRKYAQASATSYGNVLTIHIRETLPKRYFPEDSNEYTMEYTHFYAIIYPDLINQYGTTDSSLIDFNYHTYESSSNKWNNSRGFTIDIPFYAFYFIPHGKKQVVYFKIYQVGCPLLSNQCLTDSSHLWATIKTELTIPQLYKSSICTDSIILRNDDTSSPVGMDFSFRLGLPDIYWYFTYNAQEEENFSQHFRSREATYAVLYSYQDTVSFIHYKQMNEINISVWDRDDLSRDDFIGEWHGNLEELSTPENNDYTVLQFNNIDKFKIKVLSKNVSTN